MSNSTNTTTNMEKLFGFFNVNKKLKDIYLHHRLQEGHGILLFESNFNHFL